MLFDFILECGLNEKIGCASSCTNRLCGISSNAVQCLTLICVQGCVCQEDYVRDPNTGLCIKEKSCPLPGKKQTNKHALNQNDLKQLIRILK